jgi:hypothetical protein
MENSEHKEGQSCGDPFHIVKRVDRPSTAVSSCLNGLFASQCHNHKGPPHHDLASDKLEKAGHYLQEAVR